MKPESCGGCPLYSCTQFEVLPKRPVDVLILGLESVSPPWSGNMRFTCKEERWVEKLVEDLQRKVPQFRELKIGYDYSIQCFGGSSSIEAQNSCSKIIRNNIANKHQPKVIISLGIEPFKSFGRKVTKLTDMRGKIFGIEYHNSKKMKAVVTYPAKSVSMAPDLMSVVENDFVKAFWMATGKSFTISDEKRFENCIIPKTVSEVKHYLKEIKDYCLNNVDDNMVSFDVETAGPEQIHGLRSWAEESKIIAVSLGWANKGLSLFMDHRESYYDWREFEAELRDIFADPAIAKTAHNGKFDWQWLHLKYGFEINQWEWDSMLGEHLLAESKKGNYDLGSLTSAYLPELSGFKDILKPKIMTLSQDKKTDWVINNYREEFDQVKLTKGGTAIRDENTTLSVDMFPSTGDCKKIASFAAKKESEIIKNSTYEDFDPDLLLKYAALDAITTIRISWRQRELLYSSPKTERLMWTHCIPLSKVLGKMEFSGVKINNSMIDSWKDTLDLAQQSLRDELDEMSGKPGINLNSNPTLSAIFIDMYKLPVIDKTATGAVKVDKRIIDIYANEHNNEFAQGLIKYKEVVACRDKFLKSYKELSEMDQHIHTTYNIIGTATGRLSSSKVNLQNVPSKPIAGIKIKSCFGPTRENHVLAGIDIQAAEFRLLTAYAPDEGLIQSIRDGLDLHCFVASKCFGKTYEEIKEGHDNKVKEMTNLRKSAKSVGFGIIYGTTEYGLSRNLDITTDEARDLIGLFLDTFPAIRNYMDRTKDELVQNRYVETVFGRRRRFPNLLGSNLNDWELKRAIRQAINFKIQSTASDLFLNRMIRVDQEIEKIGGRLVLTVHDSIVAEIKEESIPELREILDKVIVEEVAEEFKWLPVPFLYDIDVGENYGVLS